MVTKYIQRNKTHIGRAGIVLCSQYNVLNMYPLVPSSLRPDFRALLILLLLFLCKMNTYNGECSPNSLSSIQRKLLLNLKVYKSYLDHHTT